AHPVDGPLASHPRVRYVRVPRQLRSHRLGAPLLDWTGRAEANRLRATAPQARVIVNGSNCKWAGYNWVHYVHHAYTYHDRSAGWLSRLRARLEHWLQVRRERQRLPRCPLLIANSHSTQDHLVRMLDVPQERVARSEERRVGK